MTADCIPILLTNKAGTFVAAIHAGWRGLLNDIIYQTLQKIPTRPENILVYIGPSICQKHFEVGTDLYDKFIQANRYYREYFTSYDNFNGIEKARFTCNLSAIATWQLLLHNIPAGNVTSSVLCTYCRSDILYSYRRDGTTGRFASLIWLIK